MSCMLQLLLLPSLLISVCYSAVFYQRQHIVSGLENLCYDKEENIFYKKGQEMKWKMKECGKKVCRGSNGNDWIYEEIHTCGIVQIPPECQVEVNMNLPYPQCCQRVICNLKGNIP